MKIQLKGFYLKEEAAPNNGQRSYTVMDRKGNMKALVIPETNKDGQLCNYLIINISSVPKGYEGTKMGLVHSLKLNQEELDSFEQWWSHGIINQLSKPDQEITFNVGESGPMIVFDGFKYTFGVDFLLMLNAHSNDMNELIEIYTHIFDTDLSTVKEIFERVQTYMSDYSVTSEIDPAYGVFEVPEIKTELVTESLDVTVKKFRCTLTNLNAQKINNLVGVIWDHIPNGYSKYHTEIDPRSIKVIHGELKEKLCSHTEYLKEDGLHLYGDHDATFRPQTFGFTVAKEIGNYTLDFDIYICSEETSPKDIYIKMNEMIETNPNSPAVHHIIL